MQDLLILIDGHSLMYRAFYALPILSNDKGVFTNAVYGFLNMMLKIIQDEKPSHIAVAFDVHGKTFRHDKYDKYKAGRKPTPEELVPQFDVIIKILSAMGISNIGIASYEADDIIGTLSKKAHLQGLKTKIITGDKDAFQLINDDVEVLLTRRGISQVDIFNQAKLIETYGIKSDRMIDLKGLMGDNSDNIPGIPSVGEKTAIKLLAQYKTLEDVLEHADEIKGKLGEKIRANMDMARLSYELATIDLDVPIELTLDDCRFIPLKQDVIVPILQELGLNTIIRKVVQLSGDSQLKDIETLEIIKLKNLDDVATLAEELKKSEIVSFDISDNVNISDGKKEYKISIMHNLLDDGFDLFNIIINLKSFFESSIPKVIYDAKKLMHVLLKQDIKLNNIVFDVYIAGLVLGRGLRGSKDTLIENTLGYNLKDNPASMILQLMNKQKNVLKVRNQQEIFNNIEMPLIKILFDIEKTGFKIDDSVLKTLDKEFSEQLRSLTSEIYNLAGEPFNINSPKQLGVILFENLGLPSFKKKKTGYSTDAEVLEKLREQHEIILPIIKYRGLAKLKGTYIDGIMPLISKAGRLHTQLNQIGASTGRLSSSAPNLQNIPIRTKEGVKLRKSFVATDDEHILVDADYSQIELRVLAHISEDENMLDAFKSGEDIHRRTASEVFEVAYEDVTGEMRSSAKAVNFGIVYGISDFGLARQLKIPKKEAGEYIQKYFIKFPKIHEFMDKCVESGRENGFVKTMYERRIYLPQLRSSNYNQRSSAERVAMNAPIQGSAADIMKLAMIAVYNKLEFLNLKSKLILQVHDELIIDTLISELEIVKELVKSEMENVAKLKCALIVDVNTGKSWYDAK